LNGSRPEFEILKCYRYANLLGFNFLELSNELLGTSIWNFAWIQFTRIPTSSVCEYCL
jgi:hypothetical protein